MNHADWNLWTPKIEISEEALEELSRKNIQKCECTETKWKALAELNVESHSNWQYSRTEVFELVAIELQLVEPFQDAV